MKTSRFALAALAAASIVIAACGSDSTSSGTTAGSTDTTTAATGSTAVTETTAAATDTTVAASSMDTNGDGRITKPWNEPTTTRAAAARYWGRVPGQSGPQQSQRHGR